MKQEVKQKLKLNKNLALSGLLTDRWGVRSSQLYNPDVLIGRKGFDVYKNMVDDDPQIKAAVNFKKHALLSNGWEVLPADESDEASQIADFVTFVIMNIEGQFDDVLLSILDGLVYGFSVHELIWTKITKGDFSGKFGLKTISPKPPETFDFESNRFGEIVENGLVQFRGTPNESRLPLDKFIIWTYQGAQGNPYGTSDLKPVYRYWYSKDMVDRYWNIALEKHAMPIPKGRLPVGATDEEKQVLLSILSALQNQSAVVVGNDEDVSFLDSTKSAFDAFKSKQAYNDTMIARSLLLPDLLMSEGSRVGSKALGEVHSDLFLAVVDQLGKNIADTINEQLVRRLIDVNYETDLLPTFIFKPPSTDKTKEMSEMFIGLVNAGILNPNESVIRERLSLPANALSDEEPSITDSGETETFGENVDEKVDFEAIEKKLDTMEVRYLATLEEVMRSWRKDLIKHFESNETERTERRLDNFSFDTAEFREAIYDLKVNASLHGGFDAFGEIERKTGKIEFAVATDLPSVEAIEYFRGKFPSSAQLLGEYERYSFTITSIFSNQILLDAKSVLLLGLTRGDSNTSMIENLGTLFDGYLQTGEIVDGEIKRPHRLETIVRTNMIEAYNQGRLSLYRSEEVRDFVPAVKYSAIIDSRTTPFCRKWDGKVLKADSERLKQLLPPNHHNCRSLIVPITSAEEYSFTPIEKLPLNHQPAKGFGKI